jgi:glycosyltransferase involved in cell wall biosynthesis
MKKSVDIVYIVASQLGSIGMGTTAYNAIKKVNDENKRSYAIFCRGYKSEIELNKRNIRSYWYLEYLSYPFRFLEKKMGLKINPFKLVNFLYGKSIHLNLPQCKIYHTWLHISPEAIKKAKKQGATLILEGANSHPSNALEILNKEFRILKKNDLIQSSSILKEWNKVMPLFDYVMCPSDFVYESFLKYGFKKEQLKKVPYGVHIEDFKVRKKKKDNKFRAVFVGSVQVRKGIHYLLQAWDELKLKDAELIIVGRAGPDCLDIVNKYKNKKNIKFIGFEPKPQKYLEDADVFVSPSLEEGSALTCYEAMASGVPLIATFNTGSIARDNKDGFIVPIRNVIKLKEKIKYMYDNPEMSKNMGKSAREYVENFTWEKYSENVSKEYESILNARKNKEKQFT